MSSTEDKPSDYELEVKNAYSSLYTNKGSFMADKNISPSVRPCLAYLAKCCPLFQSYLIFCNKCWKYWKAIKEKGTSDERHQNNAHGGSSMIIIYICVYAVYMYIYIIYNI